jgi:hypothetical protein
MRQALLVFSLEVIGDVWPKYRLFFICYVRFEETIEELVQFSFQSIENGHWFQLAAK